eukprot:CCRYP_003904-RA/>CCRYP_003904-RA protein AED:0.21 eAED:-0.09 QI:0/-1/0/1/-1/0/1/0/164
MPAGFGVSNHRMFVLDIRTQSIVGSSPPKVVRMAARRLNTTIPHVAERYVAMLERLTEEHRLNSRFITVASSGLTSDLVWWNVNKIDKESIMITCGAPNGSVGKSRTAGFRSCLRRPFGFGGVRSTSRFSVVFNIRLKTGVICAEQLNAVEFHVHFAWEKRCYR